MTHGLRSSPDAASAGRLTKHRLLYSAGQSGTSAHFRKCIDRQALALASFPERGRIVPEVNDPQVREIIHRDYRIIYEVFEDPKAVFILRFWHAARGKPEVSKID